MAEFANQTDLTDMQSKAIQGMHKWRKEVTSSNQDVKSGSTETSTVTDTPKVTQTAKAMPSVNVVPVLPSTINANATTTNNIDFKNLLSITREKLPTPDLLNPDTEKKEVTPIPGNIIESAKVAGGSVNNTVNEALLSQFSNWFEYDTGDKTNILEYTVNALGYYTNKGIDTIAKALGAKDTATTAERNKYWDEKFTKEQKEKTENTLLNLGISAERLINDTEYFVVKLADVINQSLGGHGYLVSPAIDLTLKGIYGTDKSYTESFQEQQGWFWDTYGEAEEEKSSKVYAEDKQAQYLSQDVSDYIYEKTGNEYLSNMLGRVAGNVYATVRDPEQIAGVVGYMAPALIAAWATGGGFLTNTLIRAPSQSTNVYKDFSTDPSITENYSDNEIFAASTGLGVILSMVESFGDAVGDMPWAKSMSRTIRKEISNILKKDITKVAGKELSKEITDVVDKNLIKDIKNPILNALKKWYLGGFGEGTEEVIQDTLQTEGAIAMGSDREHMTLEQALTTFFTAKYIATITQGLGTLVNIKQNKDLRNEYNEFSEALDKVAPGINEETKQAFFSAMITSQQNDANLSEKRVEKYESQVTQLYNQISELENQLETTTDENEKTNIKEQITNLNNEITEIDNKINQWNNTREEIDRYIDEYNQQREEEKLTQPEQTQQIKAEGEENLSQQTMRDTGIKLDKTASDKVHQATSLWSKEKMRKDFEKSVNDILYNKKEYSSTSFAKYAYRSSGIDMRGDTQQREIMISKVEELLNKIGVGIAFTSDPTEVLGKGVVASYLPSEKHIIYTRDYNEMTTYGHEVFHAMMDVIKNGKLTDKEMQTKLQLALNRALIEVKKEMGINGYIGDRGKYANMFAEEWLANAFGEYLAKRELTGPKTFRQKIEDFFAWLVDAILGFIKTNKSLSDELGLAFKTIAEGKVEGGFSSNYKVDGENLSKQTMSEIKDNEVEVEEDREKEFRIPHTSYEYQSLAAALKQPQNTYLQDLSKEQLVDMRTELMKAFDEAEEFGTPSVEPLRQIIMKINDELMARDKKVTVRKTKFKNAKDYVQKMIEIDKRNGVWSKSRDRDLRKKYMSQFLRTNLEGDFSAHLPGLKGVNLKQIEGKLSEKNIKDIAEMLSLVSTTLGVDFNKVITDKSMSMNIVHNIKDFLYNTGALGVMSWQATKDMISDLSNRTGERFGPDLGADIAKAGVALTLQEGPVKSGATMAHELMHLIDFALSAEEGLPLYFEKSKLTYTSIIKDDSSWKTYTKGNYDKDYYNRWQEILARYAEQYFAYKNDKDLFDEFTKRPWYWTEQEFMNLIPKFESFIKNRLGAKLLDEENKFYNDIVRKLNENKFAAISTEFDTEGLSDMDIKQKLDQIEEEYAFIMTHLNEMTGTLKEEMEAYVQLSNLQSNYEMAKAKGQEYLDKLKTVPEQQGTIDDITTTVLPPEPVPGNPNPTPPQNPEEINNGMPQLGGSNIENGIGNLSEGGNGEQLGSSYMEETTRIKLRERKNKIKNFRKELGQAWHDVITPAFSRIYNISPRVAGRLITMETQKDINIYRYRQKAKGFVESLGKLKGNQALEVKKALLDYGALVSEQTEETIAQYKEEEVKKLKEVLLRNGFKEKDINDMFYVLDDIGQQYKASGLDVTLTDMYFPRVVKDYEGLIDYMNRMSDDEIKVNKTSLMIRIKQIQQDPKLTDEQKEKKIRQVISMDFKQPGTTSQHGKERKLGLLSDWGEGIYAYYENPIESIDHYITTMVNAIERQLFLGGIAKDANIDDESDIINMDTVESVSTIIGKLVESGQVSEDDVDVLQKSILAVLNKKPSPKSVTAIKDITYISTITNFLSAINQLDDLGVVILKDRSGLKNIVKTIFRKADIKYDDLGLEDAYEMFREEFGVTNWLFKKSFFNFFDRLGKTSFVNTAWESLIHQSKNEKTRKYLYTRLVSMYGKESADRMMQKIDDGDYKGDDGQIDIEILRDLLYQLGSTQPIYTSAMPTAYLNHPWTRLCYALSSFTLKRIDWLVQGTKEVNAKHGKVAAGAWLMGVSTFLAMFGAAVGDIGDLLKGKKEETFLWNLITEGIDEALKKGGTDMLDSWLKIWDLSEYDLKTFDRQGLKGLIGSKISPFIFDLGKDFYEAIKEHDKDEITDLAKYVPIFGKLVYYWCFEDLGKATGKSEWNWDEEEERDWSGDEEWNWDDDEEWNWDED